MLYGASFELLGILKTIKIYFTEEVNSNVFVSNFDIKIKKNSPIFVSIILFV